MISFCLVLESFQGHYTAHRICSFALQVSHKYIRFVRFMKMWVNTEQQTLYYYIDFQVFTIYDISFMMSFFRDFAPCSLIDIFWHFRRFHCLHHQISKLLWNVGQYLWDYTAQHPSNYIVTVRTSNHIWLHFRSFIIKFLNDTKFK